MNRGTKSYSFVLAGQTLSGHLDLQADQSRQLQSVLLIQFLLLTIQFGRKALVLILPSVYRLSGYSQFLRHFRIVFARQLPLHSKHLSL